MAYKTILKIEILSPDEYNFVDLSQLAYDIVDGDCSGHILVEESVVLSDEDLTSECAKHGTDISFFDEQDWI
jgi:hypothetical protein